MAEKKNVVLMKPLRNSAVEWEDSDIVVLRIKRDNALDRLMHRFFKTSTSVSLELDEIGSFVWKSCDGKKSIFDISKDISSCFGEKANPVLERLLQYIKTLSNNNLIKLE